MLQSRRAPTLHDCARLCTFQNNTTYAWGELLNWNRKTLLISLRGQGFLPNMFAFGLLYLVSFDILAPIDSPLPPRSFCIRYITPSSPQRRRSDFFISHRRSLPALIFVVSSYWNKCVGAIWRVTIGPVVFRKRKSLVVCRPYQIYSRETKNRWYTPFFSFHKKRKIYDTNLTSF